MLPKLALLLTTLSPLVYSASIWGLPNCASSCVTSSFGGCSQIDIECICQNTAFISSLTCCVAKSCDDDEQAGIQLPSSLLSYHPPSWFLPTFIYDRLLTNTQGNNPIRKRLLRRLPHRSPQHGNMCIFDDAKSHFQHRDCGTDFAFAGVDFGG